MAKYSAIVFILLFSFSICPADTFTHAQNGETFNGYVISGKQKGNKNLVRIFNKSPRYIDLSKYKIKRNHLGRKKRVSVFNINDSLTLLSQAQAFEKAITTAANQGPLFILVTIDTPTVRIDLAQRICSAIIKIDNCDTVAFVKSGKFSGAFAEAAIIALSCDKVFMHQQTAIGAGGLRQPTSSDSKAINYDLYPLPDPNWSLTWNYFSAQIAELKGRPVALVKAMQQENIEVIEVTENDKTFFIDSRDRTKTQTIVRTISEKGQLLRLTASQAVQYGIADKVVSSSEQLLAALEAAKAKRIPNNSLLKAKRRFERVKRTMDRIMSFINPLESRSKAIVTELELVEKEIDRLNDILLRERFGVVRRNLTWFSQPGLSISGLERLVIYRNELMRELLDISSDLIRNYRRAIPLARKQPDLNQNLQTLEQGLTSAEAKFEELQIRFRLSY